MFGNIDLPKQQSYISEKQKIETRSQNIEKVKGIGIYDDFAGNEDADFQSDDDQ